MNKFCFCYLFWIKIFFLLQYINLCIVDYPSSKHLHMSVVIYDIFSIILCFYDETSYQNPFWKIIFYFLLHSYWCWRALYLVSLSILISSGGLFSRNFRALLLNLRKCFHISPEWENLLQYSEQTFNLWYLLTFRIKEPILSPKIKPFVYLFHAHALVIKRTASVSWFQSAHLSLASLGRLLQEQVS